MRRQELIALLGGSLALWAWITPALTQTMPIIGFLNNGSPEPFTRQLEAFHQGLSAAGYNKDRNVAIEYRWAEGRYDRLQALAAELIGLNAKIIVATGGATTEQAARAQSATIPIVVVTGSDPDQVGAGANPRLGRRNVTGVSVHHAELAAKRLDVLRELVPRPAKLAYLLNPNQALAEIETRTVEAAARETGVNLLILKASTQSELAPAIAAAVREGADSLLVSADTFFTSNRDQIVALAAKHALRAAYPWREYVEAGGLMSYGPRLSEVYREIGLYAGRVLKGTAPADLPVQGPRKFELMINLRTAKELGVTVPLVLLARTDAVIE
jgi:putative tryptophan/tyrosine transport system substrate-binding protein